VIPETLGNTEHRLPRGVVCDKCNNYFACNVEAPLLADPYFKAKCSEFQIATKKGRAPRVGGLHLQTGIEIELIRELDCSGLSVGAKFERDEPRWIESVRISDHGTLMIPASDRPDPMLLSRFLAKVALECLALRLLEIPGGLEEIVTLEGLNPIREFARRGGTKDPWRYHERRIYPPEASFGEDGNSPYQVLHEWTFLITDEGDYYLVLAVFGMEYAINLGAANDRTYEQWLVKHQGVSPLYPEGITLASFGSE
jgi:hypothetical protein